MTRIPRPRIRQACHLLELTIIAGLASCPLCNAAVSIVDTFDQGGFSISFGPPSDEVVNLPLAERRTAAFGGVAPIPGTTMGSVLDSSAGKLTFLVNGTSSQPNFPLSLLLTYSGPGPYNIAGCTGFVLGFSEFSGVGSLYVELGSAPGSEGIHRVDVTGPGDIFFPVADVRLTTSHSLDSFNILRFIFEARSTQFSFTLDEIRLVPEPSGVVLALAAGAGLMARRRRVSVPV